MITLAQLRFAPLFLLLLPAWLAASEAVPKQVSLIVNGNRLIASNVRGSNFEEYKLNAQEDIVEQVVAEAVIIVVTNQRYIAYGVNSGWRPKRRHANEKLKTLEAEDFAAFLTTSERYLNFNGKTGTWGERDRRVSNR